MIPKLIHYCWFGPNSLSELEEKCLNSWKVYFPDHKIILWNEHNSPMDHPYVANAYRNKKWSNISNFVRLYALSEFGGWYFDTDIEVVKSPDFSDFKETCFLGIESYKWENEIIVNNAVIASLKNSNFIRQSFDYLIQNFDGIEAANLSSPIMTTKLLNFLGFKRKAGVFDDVRVFPKEIFYPSSFFDIHPKINKNSLTIHYFKGDWIVENVCKDDYIKILRSSHYYKSHYYRIRKGKITIYEWLKISVRFFLNSFNLSKK